MALPSKGRPRVRLLIADIDGTLVTKEKLLTPKSIQALQRLNDAGILFGITTGRPPKGTRMLLDSLPGLKFIAGFNGGIVVRRDFSIFAQNFLPPEAARQLALHGYGLVCP
jgi:HAD superfamily hydrolase (TIGR01484 family)